MEFIPHGDLDAYIHRQPSDVSETEAKLIAKQLLDGLNIMHGEGFVHRDLKPKVGDTFFFPSP